MSWVTGPTRQLSYGRLLCRSWTSIEGSLKLEEALLKGLEMNSVKKKKRERPYYSSISLPASLVKEVEKVVEQLGYWSHKTAFMHEAVMEKLERYKMELKEKREAEEVKEPKT